MTQPCTAKDRRSSARTRLFTLVYTNDNRGPLWSWDIGLTGMQCRARNVRMPGTYIDLQFTLPGDQELVKISSQVASLDRDADGYVSLGLRFPILTPRVQMAIYRFMDRRRAMWDENHVPVQLAKPPPLPARSAAKHDRIEKPFQGLLLDAYQTMREQERKSFRFTAQGGSAELEQLARLVGLAARDAA